MTIQTVVVGAGATNCYYIQSESQTSVIVDPGDEGSRLVKLVENSGTTLKAILITHGHYDHISGLEPLVTAFPHVKIYMSHEEIPVVEWSRRLMPLPKGADLTIEKSIHIEDGEKIQIDDLEFTVLYTPGHSQGGVVYLLEDNLFSGDTLFYKEIGRCDLVTGDYEVMLRTLKKLAQLEGDYKVYPGHMESTTLDFERNNNPYMQKVI